MIYRHRKPREILGIGLMALGMFMLAMNAFCGIANWLLTLGNVIVIVVGALLLTRFWKIGLPLFCITSAAGNIHSGIVHRSTYDLFWGGLFILAAVYLVFRQRIEMFE